MYLNLHYKMLWKLIKYKLISLLWIQIDGISLIHSLDYQDMMCAKSLSHAWLFATLWAVAP